MKHATILFLGAALLATPAFAQSASDNNAASPAMTGQANGSTTTAADVSPDALAKANGGSTATMSSGSNGQMAMNNDSASASASSDSTPAALASVPDTKKRYKASSRASDFAKEAETTKELNQQVASAGGIPKTQQ